MRAVAASVMLWSAQAALSAAGDQVVIGDIDDFSGLYADEGGTGGVESINMAIADFGGSVLGKNFFE
jgi:branched-chain amino acid transport system substrate-binding protein